MSGRLITAHYGGKSDNNPHTAAGCSPPARRTELTTSIAILLREQSQTRWSLRSVSLFACVRSRVGGSPIRTGRLKQRQRKLVGRKRSYDGLERFSVCLLAPTSSQLPSKADLRSQMTSQTIIFIPPLQLDPLRNKLNKIFQKKNY